MKCQVTPANNRIRSGELIVWPVEKKLQPVLGDLVDEMNTEDITRNFFKKIESSV
jgi:hypothetical protein